MRSGAFSSASEVVRAGLRVPDREEQTLNTALRERIESALADPRSSEATEDVFEALRAHHAKLNRAQGGDL
jgi:antitoxin ParD1/3/4